MAWLAGRDWGLADRPGATLLAGHVLDGDGAPVPDAMLEVADAAGHFGRCLTDYAGHYSFVVMEPTSPGRGEAPHLEMSVFARGLLQRLWTRVYFPDQTDANAADPLLRSLPDPERLRTLVAQRDGDGLRFDVRLQGDRETVFLDW
ncbi:MAG: protocatechuate 3,4-dioxygenase subunit alpha [Actinomycetota bacterium]|nr:protocatechuate 3,4-dioxygenase subunit alpha [Actinomycetota bacterium]